MPRRARFLVVPVLLAGLLAGCGGTPKSSWLLLMRKTSPMTLCTQSFFKHCFDWEPSECREAVKPHLEACIAEVEPHLPMTLNGQTGGEWGRKIGECTGGAFAEASMERIEIGPACEDVLRKQGGQAQVDAVKADVAAYRAEQAGK